MSRPPKPTPAARLSAADLTASIPGGALGAHPLFTAPGALALLTHLDAANAPAEWNAAVARLARFLLLQAVAPVHDDAAGRVWVNTFERLIRDGYRPHGRGRARQGLQARRDALILRTAQLSFTQSVELLAEQDRAAARYFHRPVAALTQSAMRKRIERAERAGGFRLPRDPPFGKKD